MKVMSKDPGKVWCIWRVYLGVINAKKKFGIISVRYGATAEKVKKFQSGMVKFWKSEILVFQLPFFLCMSWTKTTNTQYWAICGVSVKPKKKYFFLIFFEKIENFDNFPILRDRKYEDLLASQDQNRAVFWKADKICFPARYGLICFWARLDPQNRLRSFF